MAGNVAGNDGQRSVRTASQCVKQRGGVVNRGLDYESRVITYLAMLLNKQNSILDFIMYTSPEGLRPIDDIVVKIKFEDDDRHEKEEIWLVQIKHVLNRQTKQLRYIYSTQNELQGANGQNQNINKKRQPCSSSTQEETVKNPKEQKNAGMRNVKEQRQHTQIKQDQNNEQRSEYSQEKTIKKPKQHKSTQKKRVEGKGLKNDDSKNSKNLQCSNLSQEEIVAEQKEEKTKGKKANPLVINLDDYVKVYETLSSTSHDIASTTEESDIMHWVTKSNVTKMLLFTNANPMDLTGDSSKEQQKNVLRLTKAENSASWSKPFNSLVECLNQNKCMKCLEGDTSIGKEEFLDKFYTFVSQPNADDILTNHEKFEMMHGFSSNMIDQLCDLIESHMLSHSNIGMCTPLTKKDLMDICLTTVMTNTISLRTCIPIKADKQYADIWADIFNMYQIVQLDPDLNADDTERLLQNITGYYEYVIQKKYDPKFDWEKCIQRCFQLSETIKSKVKSTYTLVELLLYMWKFDRLPLIIDKSVNKLFFNFQHKDQQFDGRFFVIAESTVFPDDIRKLTEISQLSQCAPKLYDDITNLEVSLQGRKPVLLGKVFTDIEGIRPTYLLLWTGQHMKYERTLHQKKSRDNLLHSVNCYDAISVEICLDIEAKKIDNNKKEHTDPEKAARDMKEAENKEQYVVFKTCNSILADAVHEGDFLVWKCDNDQSKLSKSRKIFEKEYELPRKFPENQKTLKLTLELEQQLFADKDFVDICKRFSDNLSPDKILNQQKTGYNVLKYKLDEALKLNSYCLSLNIYVTQHDEASPDYRQYLDRIDFDTIKNWMNCKNVDIDDVVPANIIIDQSVYIVPEYTVKGGSLKISLQRRNDKEEILKEIIIRCIDAIKDMKNSEWTSQKIQIPQIGMSLNDNKGIQRTVIDRTFVAKDSDVKFSEDDMGSRKRKQLVAISNLPGMGKTTALKLIAARCNPEDYVLITDLTICARFLHDLNEDPITYIFNKIKQDDSLEELLFQQHRKKTRIKILLDSFDEILPLHENEVLLLLEKVLDEGVNTTVTTRSQAEDKLMFKFKDKMEIINLLELQSEEVRRFCNNEGIDTKYISRFAEGFLTIPLHLQMLCDIIKTNTEVHKFELCDFFKEFIKLKVEIFYKEKNDLTDNVRHRLGIVLTNDQMYDYLYNLALVCIFGRQNTIDIIVVATWNDTVNKFNEYVLPLGIVDKIYEDSTNVKFTHRSFAEYLVADWFCNVFLEDNKHHMRLYLKMLENNEVQLVKFLNDKATTIEGCLLHKAIKNRDKQEVKHIIESFTWEEINKPDILRRYPIDVATGLLSNNHTETRDYFEMLKMVFEYYVVHDHLRGDWYWDESLIRILGRDYKQLHPHLDIVYENNSSLHLATFVGDFTRVKYLVESARLNSLLYNLNYDGWNVLHLATYYGHEEIVRYLVEDLKMNPNRLTVERSAAEENVPVQRTTLELAELNRAQMNSEKTIRIIKILKDNGCLASERLSAGDTDFGLAFTNFIIPSIAQKLSKDANCQDFEIIVHVPKLSAFNHILVIYTSKDNKKTAYFVETKMNIDFDENSGNVVIPRKVDVQHVQDTIQAIANNLLLQWNPKLANIDNIVLCLFTSKTSNVQPLREIESPVVICSQKVYKYCVNEKTEIFIHTGTASETTTLQEEFESEMGFERYTSHDINDDFEKWMFSTRSCRPLSKQMFELICFRHKLKTSMGVLSSWSVHYKLFDGWVKVFCHNHLIFMDNDEHLIALMAGYFEQYVQLYYDESFVWYSTSKTQCTISTKDSINKAYAYTISSLNDLLVTLWIFDQQPLVIRQSENFKEDLETYRHLMKTLIVLIDDENKQCEPTKFDQSSKGVPELLESIKFLTGKELSLPCTMSDLLLASSAMPIT